MLSRWVYIYLKYIIKDFESLENELPNKKWVIFNNNIVSLENLVHPGGNFIWQ